MKLANADEINAALKKMFPDPEQVMHAIAAANADLSAIEGNLDWWAMDMCAYAKVYPTKGAKPTEAAKQNYINVAITAIQSETATDTVYGKAILALSANGVDATRLYPVNSNTPINAIALLNKISKSSSA